MRQQEIFNSTYSYISTLSTCQDRGEGIVERLTQQPFLLSARNSEVSCSRPFRGRWLLDSIQSGRPKQRLGEIKDVARDCTDALNRQVMGRWPVPADHLPGQVFLHGTKGFELVAGDDGAHSSLRFAAHHNSTHLSAVSTIMRCEFRTRHVEIRRLNLTLK
jgi:hypothetical protein